MTDKTITRRGFIGAAAVAIPAAALLTNSSSAATDMPKLDVNDPVAKALMYVNDAAQVDKAKAPTFKAGETCAGCIQLQGATGDWRPCNAFPGKLVSAKGWCSAWAAKPA